MTQNQQFPGRTSGRAVIAWQSGIAATVLLVAIAYPRAGGAGLVIPLHPESRAADASWLQREGAAIIAPSTDARFYLVRVRSDRTAARALGQGLILISVPSALCGPQDN